MEQNSSSFFGKTFKYFMWQFFDYIVKIIFISMLWFLFTSPLFFTIYVFLYSGIKSILYYVLIINIIIFSPFSFGAYYAVLQIPSQIITSKKMNLLSKVLSRSEIKVSFFFKGIFKYFFKSIGFILLNSVVSIFLYINIYFYWNIVTPKSQILGLFLTGFFLWIALIYAMMLNYIIPFAITKKNNIFKTLYQSFLLVIDNLFFSLALLAINLSFLIILAFTLAGIFAIFYGSMALLNLLAYFILYQKYDETLKIKKELRTMKNLFKPWQ